MDNSTTLPDWSLIQSFLAVAETGSLSAAARQLNRSQPTLGRHIQTLEQDLGCQLFDRHPRGLQLSPSGTQLLPMAREMHAQMNAIALSVAGQSQQLSGTVRITASVFASHYVLPPILAQIRQQEPSIDLELVPSDSSENLLFRAADIAVRMYRPTQLDIIIRHVCDLPLGVFAAHSYLNRRGTPETIDELLQHDLVGYDSNDLILRTTRSLGWTVDQHDFATRCDNQATYWELVRAGCGIGFSQTGVGRHDPLVQELDLGLEIPPLPVWLAAHQAMRQTPRVSRVWTLLAQGLTDRQ
ncbi:LysR family transcriptional regulator [Sedimentitalea sp. CY04]|uniref:LysR family transcriptional regulator n=1 Tax=Parasedimentitalea denitrificans TaxID=2211118 RepID=A0ABX0W7K3_9RHOB|nr:LysR family transcriptional regulator [Sedimentitalea sp. CY04]NIZ60285.1 LysR family transcriptional regulator [Sedimentitalea sp. CY04]